MSNIINDLEWRYACKAFDANKKISSDDLKTILNALALTPSSYGLQPWKFVVVENKGLREQLVDVSWKQKQVQDASHLIVLAGVKVVDEAFIDRFVASVAKTRGQEISEIEGYKKMMMNLVKWSPERQHDWAKNQSYIALGNLMTVCAQMRIDTCPMEGFSAADYDRILGLEEKGLTSMVVCPVGYRSESDSYSSLKKVRYSVDELTLKI